MIVTLDLVVDAIVVKMRARKEIPVELVVRRNFAIRDVGADEAPFATNSGTQSYFMGPRFDWHAFEDDFWRVIGEDDQSYHLSVDVDAKVSQMCDFGRPWGEKTRTHERIREEDVKDVVSTNVDEIAALVAEWLDDEFVAIDGRIARREGVPILTSEEMASLFSKPECGYQGLPPIFPICLWDLDASLPQTFVDTYKTNKNTAAAAQSYEPVVAPDFDRYRELAPHHARTLMERTSAHKVATARQRAAYAILRDAVDRRVSGTEVMELIGRVIPSEVAKPEYEKLLERFGPPKKTRYPMTGNAEGSRLMFDLGMSKGAVVAETRVPRMDGRDAPVVAILEAAKGPAVEIRMHGGEWLVPVVSDGKVGSSLVRTLDADADPWARQDTARHNANYHIRKTAAAHGLITETADPETKAAELVRFASDHLVEIDGTVHMRSGEPFLLLRSSSVEIRTSLPGRTDEAMRAAIKNSSYSEKSHAFGLKEAQLMEAVATTDAYAPKDGPVLARCSILAPGVFAAEGRLHAASVVLERVLGPTTTHQMPASLTRLVDAAALSASRARSFHPLPADPAAIEDMHDRFLDLAEEIAGRSVYARLAATPAFAALRDGVIPALAGYDFAPEDENVLSDLRM